MTNRRVVVITVLQAESLEDHNDCDTSMTPTEAPSGPDGGSGARGERSGMGVVGDHLATEQGVYGVILVAGLIVVSGSEPALTAFVTVVTTVVVFWAAHVYAGTVAHHRNVAGRVISLTESFLAALRPSWGLLVSALIPAAILLLGVTKAVPDDAAQWAALWVCVGVLAILGFVAFRRRGSRLAVCLLGAVGTAAFGLIMVALKVLLH
jgi:hypothetical protein